MFPAETLTGIQTKACEAQSAQPVDVGDPRKVAFQVNGQIREFDVPPGVRCHVVRQLNDLVGYAKRTVEEAAEGAGPPVVWHGESHVVLVIDDSDRRDCVVFDLTTSREMRTLMNLEEAGRAPLDHASFVRLLRIKLGLPAEQVARFRKLAWTAGDKLTSDRRHAKESLDQSMMAEVSGVDGLPEEIEVRVPVYREEGERGVVVIHCAVDVDAVEKTLELMPLPGELEGAFQDAQRDIRQRLDKELSSLMGVYYGAP